jgi:hypothetical protein
MRKFNDYLYNLNYFDMENLVTLGLISNDYLLLWFEIEWLFWFEI